MGYISVHFYPICSRQIYPVRDPKNAWRTKSMVGGEVSYIMKLWAFLQVEMSEWVSEIFDFLVLLFGSKIIWNVVNNNFRNENCRFLIVSCMARLWGRGKARGWGKGGLTWGRGETNKITWHDAYQNFRIEKCRSVGCMTRLWGRGCGHGAWQRDDTHCEQKGGGQEDIDKKNN